MTEPTLESLTRENAYLRQRNAQLQEDLTALGAEAERLRQIVERLHGRTTTASPTI
jgi:prefoldin subunit 5